MLGDENVNRYCELIVEINSKVNLLKKERFEWYDGGCSFEEGNKEAIKELIDMQQELKNIILFGF